MPLKCLKDKNAHILYEFCPQYESGGQDEFSVPVEPQRESAAVPQHVSPLWQQTITLFEKSPSSTTQCLPTALFTPEFWEENQAVTHRAPGRGESLFVAPQQLPSFLKDTSRKQGSREEWVLRPYRRGGMMARVNAQRYLWTGWEHTRAFRELRLTEALRQQHLPVPEVLGACVWRKGLTYEAALLSVRIPQAQPLADVVAAETTGSSNDSNGFTSLLQRVGMVIHQAHILGLDHIDLNARNILIDDKAQPWIIDLDRCRLRPMKNRQSLEKWQNGNLARLGRSLEKFAPGQGHLLLQQIRHGYDHYGKMTP